MCPGRAARSDREVDAAHQRAPHLSCGPPGSDAPYSMGLPPTTAGLVAPYGDPQAAMAEHAAHNRLRSRSGHGHSSCRSALGHGIPHTRTAGLAPHRPRRIGRHRVDERHDCRDTRPAWLPGTVWGTASSIHRQVQVGAVLAPRSKQAFTRRPQRRQPKLVVTTRTASLRQPDPQSRHSLPRRSGTNVV